MLVAEEERVFCFLFPVFSVFPARAIVSGCLPVTGSLHQFPNQRHGKTTKPQTQDAVPPEKSNKRPLKELPAAGFPLERNRKSTDCSLTESQEPAVAVIGQAGDAPLTPLPELGRPLPGELLLSVRGCLNRRRPVLAHDCVAFPPFWPPSRRLILALDREPPRRRRHNLGTYIKKKA